MMAEKQADVRLVKQLPITGCGLGSLEITQEEDFDTDNNTLPVWSDSLLELMNKESICVQNMEDKAANAFVHYLFAKAWNDTKPFNRFATDEALAALKSSFPRHLY